MAMKRRSIEIQDVDTIKKSQQPDDVTLKLRPRTTIPRCLLSSSNALNILSSDKKRKFQDDTVISALQTASDLLASTPEPKFSSTSSIINNINTRKGTRPSPWRKVMVHDPSNDDDEESTIQPRRLSFSPIKKIKINHDSDDDNSVSNVVTDFESPSTDEESFHNKENMVPRRLSFSSSTNLNYDTDNSTIVMTNVVTTSNVVTPTTMTMVSDSEDESIKPRRVSVYEDDEVEEQVIDNESIAASVLLGLKKNFIFNDNMIDNQNIDLEDDSPPPKVRKASVAPRLNKKTNNNVVVHAGMSFAHPKDEEMLNSLHCFVREELLEVFVIGNPEKDGAMEGGQVGIRCKYCAGSQSRGAAAGGAGTMRRFFPPDLETIYQRTCTWQRLHFPFCSAIPKHLVDKYHHYKAIDKTRGRRAHWAYAAKTQGLRNSATPRGGVFYHGKSK